MKKSNLIIITILLSIIFYFLGKSINNQTYETNQNQEKTTNSTKKIEKHKILQNINQYSQNQTAKIKSRDIFEQKYSEIESAFIKNLQLFLKEQVQDNKKIIFQHEHNSFQIEDILFENIDNKLSIYFNVEIFFQEILNGKKSFNFLDVNNDIFTLNVSKFKVINPYMMAIYINDKKFYYNLNDRNFSLSFINNQNTNHIIVKNNVGYTFTHLHKETQQ